MSEITLEGAERETDWSAKLSQLNANPLHLKEVWLPEAGKKQLAPLLWREDENVVGAAVAIQVKRRRFKLIASNDALVLPTPPAFGDASGFRTQCYLRLIDFGRRNGYKRLEVGPRWGHDFSRDELFSKHSKSSLIEFTLDLTLDLDAILGNMHSKHRKNMRKAQKSDIACNHADSLASFMMLMSLQQQSAQRGASRGNPFSVPADRFARRTFEAIYNNGPGRLLVASHGDQPVAALAYLRFGDKAITVRSGSSREGYRLSAMYLLHLELIRALKGDGVQVLNIGGVPCEANRAGHPQAGLYDFKRYFGGTEHVRSRVDFPLS